MSQLTQEEMNTARGLWDELHAQWTKCDERNRWLAENQDVPDWEDLDEKARRSDLKFGRLRNELATWAGVDALQVCLLLAAPALLAPARGAGEGRG
jgi:hypothetical protein